MSSTIREKVDNELTRRVGTWFTVRQIQNKLRINPSTLKPLIMKYAREKVLKRRSVPGTARSVQFTPAAPNQRNFRQLLTKNMPYRNFGPIITKRTAAKKTTKRTTKKAATKRATPKRTTRSRRRSSRW